MASKAKEKFPSCKLSTIINNEFITVQMIGKGGYGVVYEVIRLDSPTTRFACKAELAVAHNNLKTEWDLMTLLKDNKSKHNIIGLELGTERNYNYIIMYLVGPSLADLLKSTPKKAFTLYTTTVCAIQCFDSLVELHKLGYIHRDVKPSNFAIGVLGSDEEKLIYVLDFGLCRNLFKNKVLRKPRMKAPFRGTIPYCSLNVHNRTEPGRHDDLWSLLYMMIEFHLGPLPWDNKGKEETKKKKEKQIDELLSRCPAEFMMVKSHLLSLSYSREPDYEQLRAALCQIMYINKFTTDVPLDWQLGGAFGSIFRSKETVLNNKGSKKKVVLSELLDLPKTTDKLLTEEDFKKAGEEELPRDDSVSKSDDTIDEKERPAPVALKKPSKSPVEKSGNLSKEKPKALTAQSSNTNVTARPVPASGILKVAVPDSNMGSVGPKPVQVSARSPVPPPTTTAPKPTVTANPKPPTPATPPAVPKPATPAAPPTQKAVPPAAPPPPKPSAATKALNFFKRK